MQVVINIILYEYGDEQVKIRKRRWNNKEIFIENRYVNRKLEKEGGGGGGGGGGVIPCYERLWAQPNITLYWIENYKVSHKNDPK